MSSDDQNIDNSDSLLNHQLMEMKEQRKIQRRKWCW